MILVIILLLIAEIHFVSSCMSFDDDNDIDDAGEDMETNLYSYC